MREVESVVAVVQRRSIDWLYVQSDLFVSY
jgi:hypothetical protein